MLNEAGAHSLQHSKAKETDTKGMDNEVGVDKLNLLAAEFVPRMRSVDTELTVTSVSSARDPPFPKEQEINHEKVEPRSAGLRP